MGSSTLGGPIVSVARLSAALVLLLLAGCGAIPPEPVVTGPTTALPPSRPMASKDSDGAIYQPTVYGSYPLFEDSRPRNVGDVVTVVLQEKTAATKNVVTDANRTGSVTQGAVGTPGFLNGIANLTTGVATGTGSNSGTNAFQGKGDSTANNTVTGTITTTVIGVLPNGNLQVAGEKDIAINRGSEFVKFSGVVDPRLINGTTNSILSTQVADVRLEFRSKGVMDEVQTMGWLQRFFLLFSPY